METIIVTGGAGYIGSHTIIELLQNTPYQIISIDNFSNSTKETFDRIKTITGKQIENIDIDICHLQELELAIKQIKNPIGIIHFAAYKSVGDSVLNPLTYYHNNIGSLINILSVCKTFHIPHFIFSSSCSVYGNVSELPVTEHTSFSIAESPYAHTKQIGEDIVSNFAKSESFFNNVLLRYFNPVGAHQSGLNGELSKDKPSNLVPFITQSAIGLLPPLTVFGDDYDTRDGSCIRDYIHVSDIADAHVKALNYLIEKKNGRQTSIFNLGTGNGVSVFECIHSFEKVSHQTLNYHIGKRRAGDVITIYANNTLAKSQLNWQPKYSLDDMMLSAWKWELNLKNLKEQAKL
jgi:UDP-glucose 4-epimerase